MRHTSDIVRRIALPLLLLAVGLVVTGCVRSSPYATQSSFASVHTAGYRAQPASEPKAVFPNGLDRPARLRRATHFVQFRARNALSYGHASIAFGPLDHRGRIPTKSNGDLKPGTIEITGLHPASDSKVVYSAGHIVPVYASTGPSDGDDEAAYALSTWRIDLTASEFRRLVAIVERRKRTTKFWNGVTSSCVTYLRMIAGDMGLRTPLTRHLPESFVHKLAKVNGSKGTSRRPKAKRATRRGVARSS